MKIAYDARWLFQGGHGDVTYLRNLVGAMARVAPGDEFWLYYREFDTLRESLAAQHANVHTRALKFPVGALWNQCALAPALRRAGMDVLHGNYVLPLRAPRPMVVSIHDITFRLFPEWIAPRPRRLMNVIIPQSARSATKILTGSECTRQDMIKHLGVAPEKIVVTPYAAAPHFTPHDPLDARRRVRELFPALDGRYLAAIGLRGPRKNIGVALRAILQLQARGAWPSDVKLAVAGTREQFPDAEIAKLGDVIEFLGFVADGDLPVVYSAAIASVYPSLYEGFGLPVLEAMACGCPVVGSNTSSLPEVAGNAAVLLPPDDEDAWQIALEKIIGDENHRALLRSRGLERAAQFSWEKCARQTLQVYREAARV